MYANQEQAQYALKTVNGDQQNQKSLLITPLPSSTPNDTPFLASPIEDQAMAQVSLDDRYMKLYSCYGLHIHRSKLVDTGSEVVEKQGQLLSNAKRALDCLKKDCIAKRDSLKNSDLLCTMIDQFLELLDRTVINLAHIEDMLTSEYYSFRRNSQHCKRYPIGAFSFEFRGLFLTIRYTADTARNAMKKKELDKSMVERKIRKFQVMDNLVQMGVLLLKEKMERLAKSEVTSDEEIKTRVKYYPFADTLNIHEYNEQFADQDVEEYFEHIGEQFAPKLRLLLGLMVTVTASHTNVLRWDNRHKLPGFTTGLFLASNAYYFLNGREAAKETASFFNRNLNVERGKGLWTLQDSNPLIKFGTFMSLPGIEISSLFSIPLQRSEYTNKDTAIEFIKKDEQKSELLKHDPHGLIGEASEEEFRFYLNQIPRIISALSSSEIKERIQLRIISSSPLSCSLDGNDVKLKFDYPQFGKMQKSLLSKFHLRTVSTALSDGLIFHVHGGGFLAMSSFAHECYLRPWATKTNLPIISVDYSKTPDYHYPVQLEECYQAYKWVLENAEAAFGIRLGTIIFSGDSAGGNLVLAVLIRAISEGIRIPDGLVLSYPAAHLNFVPSPARIMSLLDPLLNFRLLELCGLEYYLTPEHVHVKNNAARNPFISPSMVPSKYLSRFPRTYVNVGSLDPLFDDAIYLAKRIEEIKGREFIKLEVYDSLGHGYLNLVDFVPEAKIASDRICDWIKTLIMQQ